MKKGFTLIELLLVLGIIAIISTIVAVAINPTKYFKNARLSRRAVDLENLAKSIELYRVDHLGQLPTGLGASATQIGNAQTGCNIDCYIDGVKIKLPSACLNLDSSMIKYFEQLPVNPPNGTQLRTGYAVRFTGKIVKVYDCSEENVSDLSAIAGQSVCVPNCNGKCTGGADGCGGVCDGGCNGTDVCENGLCLACGVGKVTYEGGLANGGYATTLINGQCWLKNNLNVGTMINGNLNQTNDSIIEKYCYNNLASNCATYGAYYQWPEALQLPGSCLTKTCAVSLPAQGICPTGWHIPSNTEYLALRSFLGINIAGDQMKIAGQCQGRQPCGTSGLDFLISGNRDYMGGFANLNSYNNTWPASQSGASTAYNFYVFPSFSGLGYNSLSKNYGMSIRCVK